jgi:hypothetical protein
VFMQCAISHELEAHHRACAREEKRKEAIQSIANSEWIDLISHPAGSAVLDDVTLSEAFQVGEGLENLKVLMNLVEQKAPLSRVWEVVQKMHAVANEYVLGCAVRSLES